MFRIRIFRIIVFCLFVENANANQSFITFNWDFVAPIVKDDTSIPHRAGLIFYEVEEGLKIVNPYGEIESLSVAGENPVTSSDGDIRIESAKIIYSSSTWSESAAWITHLSDTGTGKFDVNMDSTLCSHSRGITIRS